MSDHKNLNENKIRNSARRSFFGWILAAVLITGTGILLTCPSDSYAQESDVHTVVDTMPEIVGGLKSLYDNIRYPREAVSRGIEGRVYLQFIVTESGRVEDPKVLRDIGGGCGEAALEALSKIQFTPGVHEGKPVKVLYTLPVAFRLE